ncbi:MAG TPA: archaeosine biosynthesis radical SAM protein RaSEA [Thermoplasmata archaeon]|nr:archaeosine biosynthesis radical SAM protein RaSEA [Thermoplasmata archaeon]
MPQSIAREVANERRPQPGDSGAPDAYVNCWTETESLAGERVSAFVLILRTRGCYWADLKGCSRCGYARDTLGRSATPAELARQLERALRRYRDEPYVKLYTSGSFLDDREVDPASREAIGRAFSGRARRLLIETLPEFVKEDRVRPLQASFSGELEVAEGLESTQPDILARYVNKVSTPAEYFDAADRLRAWGAHPKGYLLLKPPYLTEGEAIEDVVLSIGLAAPHFSTLSVNPVHIQNGTVVERLFRNRRYRPPWLWSLLEVLRRGATEVPNVRLVSFPTAGGRPRGPHNCGACDPEVLRRIEEGSLDQSFGGDSDPTCGCQETWIRQRELEALGGEA